MLLSLIQHKLDRQCYLCTHFLLFIKEENEMMNVNIREIDRCYC